MKIKKVFLALGIILLALLIISAGGRDTHWAEEAEELPVTGRLVVQVFDRGTDGGRSIAHNNEWTRWIQARARQDLGIEVTFLPVGRWTETTDIVNLMAAGRGAAPDLCYTYAFDMIAAFRDRGGVMNLTPYVDSHLPDLKSLMGADRAFPGRDFIYRNRCPNTGRMYYISGYRVATAQRNIFIRKDWLDALGLPVPTTFNEFYRSLTAFRDRADQLPGNVGRNRVVPFGVNEDARWGLADLIQNFINPRMSDRDRWINTIADRNIYMDGYREGVRMMNRWYNEGLIFRDFPLMSNADDFYNMIKSGVVGAFNQNWDFPYRPDINIIGDLRRNVPNADFIPVNVVNNQEMMDQVGIHIFIPSFSPNKDSALRYLNWLAKPEIYTFLQLGHEGINHEMVNGVPRTLSTPPGHPWFMNSPNNIDFTMPINGVELGCSDLNGRALGLGYGDTPPDVIARAFTASTSRARSPAVHMATATINQYAVDLREKADELIARAISARPQDFNRIWDAGIRDWLRSGGQEVLNERRSLWPR